MYMYFSCLGSVDLLITVLPACNYFCDSHYLHVITCMYLCINIYMYFSCLGSVDLLITVLPACNYFCDSHYLHVITSVILAIYLHVITCMYIIMHKYVHQIEAAQQREA